MNIEKLSSKMARRGREGFSLLELMIVVAILGILSVSVGVYINTASTKLRTFVFNQSSRFKVAKFEAIKRGRNVYLDFDFDGVGGLDSGYTIWMDDEATSPVKYIGWNAATDDANGNGECDPGEGDCIIGTVAFSGQTGVEIYCETCASGGPGNNGPGTKEIKDGVMATKDRILFKPNGTSASNGSVYFYSPAVDAGGAKRVVGGPWAIIVNQAGRIRVDEWQKTKWKVNL